MTQDPKRRVRHPREFLLALLVLIGIAAIGGGLWIDAGNFAPSLLASLAGFVLAIFAAVFFFDELAEKESEARRRKKWNPIRVITLTAIWDQIRRMTAMRSPTADTFAVAYEATLKLMDGVSDWISTQAVQLDRVAADGLKRYEEHKTEMVALHKDVVREYIYIRDVLTPRVLELADDTRFTELLFELDEAERQWSSSVFIADVGETAGDWQSFPVSTWGALHDFHTAAVRVAHHVASAPD